MGGIFLVQIISIPAFAALRGGEGSAPCGHAPLNAMKPRGEAKEKCSFYHGHEIVDRKGFLIIEL
jgi:hypothetical protein